MYIKDNRVLQSNFITLGDYMRFKNDFNQIVLLQFVAGAKGYFKLVDVVTSKILSDKFESALLGYKSCVVTNGIVEVLKLNQVELKLVVANATSSSGNKCIEENIIDLRVGDFIKIRYNKDEVVIKRVVMDTDYTYRLLDINTNSIDAEIFDKLEDCLSYFKNVDVSVNIIKATKMALEFNII